jgi:hypothetical protein
MNEKTIYACTHIGVSGTTKCHVKQNGHKFEARIGIALLGFTNRPYKELEKSNPFDENFNDNYVAGVGFSKDEAIEAMKMEMDKMAMSLW